jgi:hypothetical protein
LTYHPAWRYGPPHADPVTRLEFAYQEIDRVALMLLSEGELV